MLEESQRPIAASRTPSRAAPGTLHIRIVPSRGWVPLDLGALWQYRELLYFLAWRDIKVRYKQTALGAAWAILQPFLTMVVFTIFFGRLAHMPSNGIPYPIFSYAALVPWTFFANGVTFSSTSMVSNSNLISKVYFPRLIIPIAAVLSNLVDFVLAFILLVGMMLYFGMSPTRAIVFLPIFLLLAIVAAMGVSIWLAALNVEFRDVRYVVPFLIQIWLFATPIAYPTSLLHGIWRTVYGLNPMVGVVDGFRWALLGTKMTLSPAVAVSAAMSLVILIAGMYYFRRMEKSFADVI